MDGTTTNINAMKLSGCKITNSDELNESFSFDGYDYELVFIMDPCHMLKLLLFKFCIFMLSKSKRQQICNSQGSRVNMFVSYKK